MEWKTGERVAMVDTRSFLRDKLGKAFDYALENESFCKTSIVKKAKSVCIYGLGKYFDEAFLRQNIGGRFGVTHLCDGSAERRADIQRDSRYKKYSCIPPEEIKTLDNPVVIFMLGDPRQAMDAVKKQFAKTDWYRFITFNDLILDDTMEAEYDCPVRGDKQELLSAFDALEDEQSCEVFVNVFCLRAAPQFADKEYEELCTLPQYFPPDIVKLTAHESVVDCGAYNGDTLQEFADISGGRFSRYDAFEIDEVNFQALCDTAREIDEKKIICHHCGVWDKTQSLNYGRMSSADSYSIFNGNETETAKVVRLDEVFQTLAEISFIKMDIEGAEMKALQGAEEILRTQRAKLAICVYHRIKDLWQIPNYIKRVCKDYKIYIRHHAKFWVSETVCYGIPS